MVTPKHTWMNGHLVPWAESSLHVSTEGVLRGASVFEGIRAYRTEDDLLLFRLADHMRRLFDTSLRFLRLESPYTAEELSKAIAGLLEANDVTSDAHIRVVVYVDELRLGRELDAGTGAFIVALEGLAPAKETMSVTLSPWRRLSDLSMPPRIKASANYLSTRIAATDAQRKGFDSAILLNDRGKVSEGPAMNVFLSRDGRLVTPRATDGILEGITRATVLEIAQWNSLDVEVREIDASELYIADEMFLCGTAYEVAPVVEIDRGPIGDGKPGPMTTLIQDAYFKLARGQAPSPDGWLTSTRDLATLGTP
jgi:branched-chain amino acid aminotransferase